MSEHTFPRKQDAIAAGYSIPSRTEDRDTSGERSFGYSYQSPEGQRTVIVWFTEEKNQMNQKGAFMAMYPPS